MLCHISLNLIHEQGWVFYSISKDYEEVIDKNCAFFGREKSQELLDHSVAYESLLAS